MSILEYLGLVWFSMVYSWVAKTVALFALLLFTTTLYSYQPRKSALLGISMAVSVLQAVPIFFAYYFTIPNSLDMFTHALYLFTSPLLVFVLYPLLRVWARIPENRCAVITKKCIGYLNVPLCVFLAAQEMLVNTVKPVDNVVSLDHIATALGIAFTVLLISAAYSVIIRKNIRIQFSEDLRSPRRKLAGAFLEVFIIYVFLVLFRMMFVSASTTTPYEVMSYRFHYLSYGVLIVMWIGYFFLEVYRDMLRAKEQEAGSLMSHIAALDEANEKFRGVKHDMNNMLQAYSSFLEIGDMDRLRAYHRSVVKTASGAAQNVELSNRLRHYMPLYSLIMSKQALCDAQGIEFGVTAASVDPGLPISDLELARILGVLLDNAIEAAAKSQRKTVALSIDAKEKVVTFIISNSCDETVNLKQIFVKDFSTKGEGRGLGLYEVGKMIKKNRLLSIFANQYEDRVTLYFGIERVDAQREARAQSQAAGARRGQSGKGLIH